MQALRKHAWPCGSTTTPPRPARLRASSFTCDDPRFEFRLRATVELAPKDPEAVAIQFTHINDMTDAEKEAVEQMGRKGQVIIKDRRQPVSGMGMLSGTAATQAIQDALPYRFNSNHFIAAYKRLNARPARGAPDPDRTNPDWCVYDEPTGWYRYTKAYVKHLVNKCSTPEGFEEATGMIPRPSGRRPERLSRQDGYGLDSARLRGDHPGKAPAASQKPGPAHR